MVSLGDDSHRTGGGYFFEEGPGSIQSQEHDDSTPLTLGSTSDLTVKKINTTVFIILEIILLIGVWVCSFVIPAEYDSHKWCTDATTCTCTVVLYIVGGVWFVQLILDRYYRYQHYQNRLCGYLNFYRRTANIRRVPLMVASAANAILLIVTQVLTEQCGVTSKCGPLNREHYLQIIISISCAIQILLLLIYLVRTISFNRSGASPDVSQEEMVTSFLQTNSGSHDIGFKDENFTDQILERQADMIRYLKQHNMQLGKKILDLTEEIKTHKQTK